jgi:hypothetical protein
LHDAAGDGLCQRLYAKISLQARWLLR